MEPLIDIALLGPVTAECDGRLLVLGGPKQRAVLAALALRPGRVVSVDALVRAVWGADAPAAATKTLQVYVANLRRALEVDRAPGSPPSVLVTREPGYVLELDPEAVDAVRLERALEHAHRLAADGQLPDTAHVLRTALENWRGTPLAGLEALPLHDHAVPRLLDLRLDALELCCQAELDLGLAGSLVAELEALVAEAPYRERLRALLARALYACGRQRDALASLQDARRTLLEDLGVDPGPELREIEQRVLLQDDSLDVTSVAPPVPTHRAEDVVRKRVSIVSITGTGVELRAIGTIVADHAGVIVERSSSSIVTAFGVPRVALDDVDRAATLALDLRGRGLALGVATGWASAAGATVSGAPISRALELSRRASPGEALLDHDTHDLLAGRAVVEPAEHSAFTLLELRALPPGADEPGPFVGRAAELDLLAALWQATDRTRQPAVVTLVGDPGVGTTRLATELAVRVDTPLCRVDLDATADPDHLVDRLSTASHGSIVLLEHVHRAVRSATWATTSWVKAARGRGVLCIATSTPRLRGIAPGWPGSIPLAVTLEVPQLDAAAAGRLAAHLIGDEVVGSRAAMVASIAGGNPLFMSELAQHLAVVDDAAPLPGHLATLLTGRVEALAPPPRRLLEAMAVLGPTIDVQQLDEVASSDLRSLDDLVGTGLVRVDEEGRVGVQEVVADIVLTTTADDRAADLHERAAATAATLTARAAHLEQAATRAPADGASSMAHAAVDALVELAWLTWSRGDLDSAVDATDRAASLATPHGIDLVERVRAARRRHAAPLVAARLGVPGLDAPMHSSVGAWDADRPVEKDLAEAALSLGATTPHASVRDRCDAVAAALLRGDAGDQGRSESSSA